MARPQGKGWFRTRRQTRGESFISAATPKTPQLGLERRRFTSLVSSRSFRTGRAGGKRLADAGSLRSLKNPFLH